MAASTALSTLPTAGIYRSYCGLLFITFLLALVPVLGFINYTLSSVLIVKIGIGLIVFSMIVDLYLVQEHILRNRMYLVHHGVTAFWAVFGFLHAEFLAEYRFSILVYMLLGALFRRLWKITKDLSPESTHLHKTIYGLMAFFDFCDPLVIVLMWGWVQSLPVAHQVIYLSLASLRVVMNAKAYPEIMSFVTKVTPFKQVQKTQ